MTENILLLPKNPTLTDFQQYVTKLKKIRNFKMLNILGDF